MKLVVVNAGRLDYARGVRLQERLLERTWADPTTEYLLLCEHAPVITLGRSASSENVLADAERLRAQGIELHEVSRGGDVTYHGPGQVVGYGIVNLAERHLGVRPYLRELEDVVIRALAGFGIQAERDPDYTGVWVGADKVCAIGVAVRRWVTYHGLALNVSTDLNDFEVIRPCGIVERGVTSMENILSERGEAVPSMDAVRDALVTAFVEVFGHDEVTHEPDADSFLDGHRRFPPWLRKCLPTGAGDVSVRKLLSELKLETVCSSAVCPNQCECFSRGTATFMILGKVCTRDCRFCAIGHGTPAPPEADEPERVAEAAAKLKLTHVVVTSVTRDDLDDGGAGQFASTIRALRDRLGSEVTIEVLVPDFRGDEEALLTVLDAGPDVLNHNVETVPRLYSRVRPGARYERSLELLRRAKAHSARVITKSGVMVGMGERRDELTQVLGDLRGAGVELLTVGQYLSPTREHQPVIRFVSPQEFADIEEKALGLGFAAAACGPFVRSSYRAGELLSRVRPTSVRPS